MGGGGCRGGTAGKGERLCSATLFNVPIVILSLSSIVPFISFDFFACLFVLSKKNTSTIRDQLQV